MGALSNLSLAAAVAVAVCCWYVYVPVPDGLDNTGPLVIQFSLMKAVLDVGQCLEYLGIDRSNLLNGMLFRTTTIQPDDDEVVSSAVLLGDISGRLYRPAGASHNEPQPGVIFIHGGGWVIGSVAMYDKLVRLITLEAGTPVVSIEYRLAPEFPFPVPFDDCYSAVKHVIDNAASFGMDASRLVVMGDSAGGNLAAAVALKLRDENVQPKLRAQVLIYPASQMHDLELPSYQQNQRGPVLSREFMAYFIHRYLFGNSHPEYKHLIIRSKHVSPEAKKRLSKGRLNHDLVTGPRHPGYSKPDMSIGNATLYAEIEAVMTNPYFSPLMAQSFEGLPESYIFTAEHDPLRDDGILHVHWLRDAGVKVQHDHSLNGYHGIYAAVASSKTPPTEGLEFFNKSINFLKRVLELE